MAGIDVKTGAAPTNLTQDIYVNNVNQGSVDYKSPIYIDLQNSGGTVVPNSIIKFGNQLAIDLPTPVPAGVAFQRPVPAQTISWNTYDTGWRAQNGWFNYSNPAYPAKFAQLEVFGGVVNPYQLKTALTVNGVTSTDRFVDLSGVQGWPALNNLNYAVLDKLTGLMFTRAAIGIGSVPAYILAFTNAFNNSVTINGDIYSDWYMMGVGEAQLIFGMLPGTGNWVDPRNGLTIVPNFPYALFAEQYPQAGVYSQIQSYQPINAAGGQYNFNNPNNANGAVFYVHNAMNLIS